jgi:hypothetical protein
MVVQEWPMEWKAFNALWKTGDFDALHHVHPNIAAAARGHSSSHSRDKPTVRKSDGAIDEVADAEMQREKRLVDEPLPSVATQQATENLAELIDKTLVNDFKDSKRKVNLKHIINFLDRVRATFMHHSGASADERASNIDDWMTQPSSLHDRVRCRSLIAFSFISS